MRDERQAPGGFAASVAKAAVGGILDSPMSCSTGLRGPVSDQTLVDGDQILQEVKSPRIRDRRHQLTGDSGGFLRNSEVMRLVPEKQQSVLVRTIVNERILTTGEYPLCEEPVAQPRAAQA